MRLCCPRGPRTLSLPGDPIQDWRDETLQLDNGESIEDPLRGKTPPKINADLAEFTQGEIELYDKIVALSLASMRRPTSEVCVWELYLYAFGRTPQIEGFSVSSDYFRFPNFRSTLLNLAYDPLFGILRSRSLCLDLPKGKHRHTSVVQGWDSAFLALFTVPSIQSISAITSLKSEAVCQLSTDRSSITRLNLHHYQIQDCDLSSSLTATPSLKYLNYHAIIDHVWLGNATSERGVGLEPLYDALFRVSDNLQELEISKHFNDDSIHFDPDYSISYGSLSCQRGQLSILKRLHTLTIPYATLLGFPRQDHV